MNILSEKYRPKELSSVLGNSETTQTLSLILESKTLPHLLFSGPPGTGKTTCAKIISKMLTNDILELNASDDRGIDIVRDKIKSFAHKKTVTMKLIILDEADSMTNAAQQALRRIMETCIDTRFILICNSFSQIFEPIQSRCAVLRFDRIKSEEIKVRVNEIAKNEKIMLTSDAVNMLIELADGDMRQALNILQSCIYNKINDEKVILKIAGQPSPKIVEKIMKLLVDKKTDDAILLFEELWTERFDPVDIVTAFFRVAKNMDSYELLKCIGPVHVRIVEGVNGKVQFYGMFHDIINLKSI